MPQDGRSIGKVRTRWQPTQPDFRPARTRLPPLAYNLQLCCKLGWLLPRPRPPRLPLPAFNRPPRQPRPMPTHILASARLLSLASGMLLAPGLARAAPAPAPSPATSAAATATTPLSVVVTIAPLRIITERIVPPGSTIEQLIPNGVSEHGYEIPPGKLRLLSRADLLVQIGGGLEPQVDKAVAAAPKPSTKSGSTPGTAATPARLIVRLESLAQANSGHDHDKDHNHNHNHNHDSHAASPAKAPPAATKPHVHTEDCDHSADNDPHWWLDPQQVEKLAAEIARQTLAALKPRLSPEQYAAAETSTNARAQAVIADIRQLDSDYTATLATKAHRTLVVTHDAWGHLARRYNLTTVPLKGLTATEPTMASLKAASEAVTSKKLTTIFIEPQLSPAAAKRIADSTGARTALLDPLGTGDWFVMMRANLAAIAASLPGAPPSASTSQPKPAPAPASR